MNVIRPDGGACENGTQVWHAGTQSAQHIRHESLAPSSMSASAGRTERERARLRKVAANRKHERWLNQHERWLNPSAAAVQRQHEYLARCETRPEQFDDEPRNDTFDLLQSVPPPLSAVPARFSPAEH